MAWVPILPADIAIDASQSNAHDLLIGLDLPAGHLHLKLPKRQVFEYFRLSVSGDLSRFSADALTPRTSPRRYEGPYMMPDVGALHQVASLTLQNEPMAQPISLECLNRFPNLKSLSLRGSFCDLYQLAGQTQLERLALRFMPDLGGLPGLSTWPVLDSFIAFNIEETEGKRLRQQLKSRAAIRAWTKHSSVSQLRKHEWWEAEFGRPFSAWPKRSAKLANEAFEAALAALAQARSIADAEAVFTAFTVRFNALKGIETAERDDLGEAVWQSYLFMRQEVSGSSSPSVSSSLVRWRNPSMGALPTTM